MLKRVDLVAALGITGIALYLGLRFFTHAGPLWRDEAATLQFANQPTYGDVLHSLNVVSLPPLYPTLVRAWSHLGWGNGDLGARVLGLLVTIAVLATIWLGSRMVGAGPPLLTLSLGAIHGIVLPTIGLVRPYGLGTLFVLAAVCGMWVFVSTPRRATFLWATAATVLAVQIQYQNTILVFVICVAGALVTAGRRDWKTAGLVVVAGVVAALSLLPYVAVVSGSQEWRMLHRSLSSGRIDWLVVRLADLISEDNGYVLLTWALVAAFGCYGALRVLWTARSEPIGENWRVIYGAIVLLGSVASFIAFFRYVDRFVQPWHVAPLIALLAFSLDMILAPPLWPHGSRLVVAAIALALLLPDSIVHAGVRQTNLDLVAQQVKLAEQKGDIVVINPWFIGITFHRYYRGELPWVTVPPMNDLNVHRFDLVRQAMVSREPLKPMETAVTEALRGGHRVWVVGGLPGLPRGYVPRDLPPPPLPITGWSDSPYTINWTMKLAYYLHTHAKRRYNISIPVGQTVNGYEDAALVMFEGWAG